MDKRSILKEVSKEVPEGKPIELSIEGKSEVYKISSEQVVDSIVTAKMGLEEEIKTLKEHHNLRGKAVLEELEKGSKETHYLVKLFTKNTASTEEAIERLSGEVDAVKDDLVEM